MALLMGLLSLVLWNPQACSCYDRAQEISAELFSHDLVALPGKGARNYDFDMPVTVTQLQEHYRYEWGWRKSKFVNRSVGVSGLLKPRMHELVRRTWMPPKELTGRAGAIRIKGPRLDITRLIVHFPPRTGESHLQGQYKECVDKLVGGLDKVMKEIPRRSLPVVLGDVNDGFRMRRGDQGRWTAYTDRYVASWLPQREHYAATKLRAFMEDWDMAARSAYMLDGPTYYGAMSQSHIDHILLPVEAPQPLRCAALYRNMRRLQLAKVREPRDHVPIAMVMQMEYGVPLRHPRLRIDTGAMMSALTTGQGRADYLEALEYEVCLKGQEIKAAALHPYTDEMWALVSGAVRIAAAKVSPPQPIVRRELSVERRRLLEVRRQLRGALDADDDSQATTQLELVMVARRMRKLRRCEEAARRQQLLDEASQHWRARRFLDLHQVRVPLARNRRAPRKRTYGIPRPPVPGVRAWGQFLAMDGSQGGMKAEPVEIAALEDDYIQRIIEGEDELFPAAAVQQQVKEDEWNMVWWLRRCRKRRSWPSWGVPAEAMSRAMRPQAVHGGRSCGGVGHDDALVGRRSSRHAADEMALGKYTRRLLRCDAPKFREVMMLFLTRLRRASCTPLVWHRSEAFPLPKGLGRAGPAGLRLIHSFDPGAMAWLGGLRPRQRDPPSWAHGGWAYKSRVAPLMIQQINAWKAAKAGKTVALVLFDATNAFASSEKESLNVGANECWGRMHAVHLEDYHTYAHMQLQTPGGLRYYRPMQGGFMGHVWAPMEFNVDYQKALDEWVVQGRWHRDECRQFVGRNLADGSLHDTAIHLRRRHCLLLRGRLGQGAGRLCCQVGVTC